MALGGTPVVLVVDDEPAVRSLVRATLNANSFATYEAANTAQALDCLAKHPVNLALLDLNLGGEDGLALAKTILFEHHLPVVMLTGKADPIDRVVGLEIGADDYIVKPFDPRELVARLRAVLRRVRGGVQRGPSADTGRVVKFGEWQLDLETRTLDRSDGQRLTLTTAEFELLEILARRPFVVMSRDVLIESMKGEAAGPFDRSIDSLVARLRKKVEADSEDPRYIKTVRGAGYVFSPR